MSNPFRLVALDAAQFRPLFRLGDEELAALGARRMIVEEKPGAPCRVSLADAEVGETVLLLPFAHHDVASPYRGTGPIFVREGVETARPGVDEIPDMLRSRLLSVRAYDEAAMLVHADVVAGAELDESLRRLFADGQVAYVHVHNAKPGCFNCSVVRA